MEKGRSKKMRGPRTKKGPSDPITPLWTRRKGKRKKSPPRELPSSLREFSFKRMEKEVN